MVAQAPTLASPSRARRTSGVPACVVEEACLVCARSLAAAGAADAAARTLPPFSASWPPGRILEAASLAVARLAEAAARDVVPDAALADAMGALLRAAAAAPVLRAAAAARIATAWPGVAAAAGAASAAAAAGDKGSHAQQLERAVRLLACAAQQQLS
ncbi:MAG: hypothetical protein J3K34DRAFT_439765 [Monoraphidium minutum]|nr:MAG: hypothetical protein J3K34DRAFT_439765 [Monoraphidium minutum]